MWGLLRTSTSLLSTFLVILTIPLAFDVGGRECGLAFSLSLSVFFFLLSLIRLLIPDESRIRSGVVGLVSASSWVMVVGLLIWSMNKFSVDAGGGSWVERHFGSYTSKNRGFVEWVFGRGGLLENAAIGGWDKVLRWSTPVFQVGEGFCSLLVIQACGQITKWLVNRERGDSWMIALLSVSAGIISSAIYFLWRITTFPEIGNVDAILIGSAITCAIFLGSWGIMSGRGNPVESSLLFAYITLCVYQIFTDYQSTNVSAQTSSQSQPALPPLPPIIMASYSTLLHALSTLPSTIHNIFNFLVAAIMTITPSVLISLAYRTSVMLAASRIIPAIRESGAHVLAESPEDVVAPSEDDDDDEAARILAFLGRFAPTILVAVYTSLLMQHFEAANAAGLTNEGNGANLWRWINVAATMAIYAVELYLGRGDGEGGMVGHWKTD